MLEVTTKEILYDADKQTMIQLLNNYRNFQSTIINVRRKQILHTQEAENGKCLTVLLEKLPK